jgi:hypothetical protein
MEHNSLQHASNFSVSTPAIDRPGTCPPYERSDVDAGTETEGPASASGAPRQHSALLDKNPKASRQEFAQQIHATSGETHRKIRALLTDHQKELENAMVQSEHRVKTD